MSSTPFRGVVTPEAVVLEFETAGIGSRGAAAAVDLIIRFTAFLFVSFAMGFLETLAGGVTPEWLFVTLLIIVSFLLLFAYPIIFEAMWDGRTPGKAIFGLRVVTVDGAPINFRHAALRGTLAMFEILMTTGAVALFASFFSSKGQRLGDYVAGTLVLRERHALPVPRAVNFSPPPGAEYFAESLDVGALRPDDYAALRSFLLRSRQLDPRARHELGQRLGRQYAERLQAIAPEGMPAEMFLVCVASAYQRRFAGGEALV